MKKSFLSLIIGLVWASFSFGQTIQNVNPTTTTAGQSITMIITGNNTNFTTVTGCSLRHSVQTGTVYQGLNFTASSATSATVNFNIPPNAPLGNYRLEALNAFANFNNALNVGVGQGSSYGYVSGKVISDANSNCVEDGSDSPFANTVVTLTPGPYYLTTGPQGDYGGWIPLGNYTLTVPSLTSCGNWVCPNNGTLPANIPVSLNQDIGNDFYWHTTVCTDLGTSNTSQPLRPGFNSNHYVTFFNHGSATASNVTVTYSMDPTVTYLSATPTPTSVVGNVATWTIASMPGGYSTQFVVATNTPVGTPLNTALYFSSNIPVVGNDPNLNNNTWNRVQNVQGSYDPNDKQVWDSNGDIAEGPIDPNTSTLRYLIRFQNTGTDTAFNIFVRDTLDADLNAGSLRVTSASHPYQVSLTGQRNVQFTFPNILLQDSFANEPLSHGFIGYEIDLNPGLPVGTVIDNDASIYFDFNSPVLTNTTHSTLCALIAPGFTNTNVGLAFNFTDASTGSNSTWQWDFGDGGTSTLQNPTHTYSMGGTYVVCLTVGNGCRFESFCDTVITCQVPAAAFTSAVTGAQADFTDQSHASVTSWAWDFGDGSTSTLQNPSHTYAANGTYTVCLTATNGCSVETVCHPVTICIPLNEAFSSSPVSALSIDFQDLSDPSANSWSWDFGDGGTSTLQNPNHVYATGGTFNVCLTVSSSCDTATTCNTLTLVGMKDALDATVSVYPNPSLGLFILQVNSESVGEMSLKVYDAKGACLMQKALLLDQGDLKAEIDLSGQAAGLYLIQLDLGGQLQSLRVQKQ